MSTVLILIPGHKPVVNSPQHEIGLTLSLESSDLCDQNYCFERQHPTPIHSYSTLRCVLHAAQGCLREASFQLLPCSSGRSAAQAG